MVCICSWFLIPKGRNACDLGDQHQVCQSCVDADLALRPRKTEIGPFHKMEKPDLDFLSLSPFLNPRKQLAQSFSAANSCSSLRSLLLFQRLTPIAVPAAAAARMDQGRSCCADGCHPATPPRFSVCLGKDSLCLLNSYRQSCS